MKLYSVLIKRQLAKLKSQMSPTKSNTSCSGDASRGVLVVFEGLDRSGKSTQTRLLTEALNASPSKSPAQQWKYPNRDTELGHIIDKYLRKEVEMDDRAVHLLFSANRWELDRKLRDTLNSGISLVVDRYAYSGVAYSAAKPTLDFEWCKQCDAGLVKPDLLVFMDTKQVRLDQREGFGEERYEQVEFQARVYENFKKLIDLEKKDENRIVLNASESIENLHGSILSRVLGLIASEKIKKDKFDFLW